MTEHDHHPATDPEWRRQAACRGSDVDFFDIAQIGAARRICLFCPVSPDCRADADAGGRRTVGIRAGEIYGQGTLRTMAKEAATRKRCSNPGHVGDAEALTVNDFYRSSSTSDGLQGWCKGCSRAASRRYNRKLQAAYQRQRAEAPR